MSRADRLEAEIKALEGKPVRWGHDDCSAWPARWVGRELGEPIGIPTYSTEREAKIAITQGGGLLALWRRVCTVHGLDRRYDGVPELGDVGLIHTDTRGPSGGIFCANGIFAWRSDDGVRFLTPRADTIIGIWELP